MSDENGHAYVQNGRLIVPWRLYDNRVIHLLTPEEFAKLPNGAIVISILGETKVKGRDSIDQEILGDRIVFGLLATEDR